MAWDTVVHGVVDVQDVVLLEGQLRRVVRLRQAVEHRPHVVAVTWLVLYRIVFCNEKHLDMGGTFQTSLWDKADQYSLIQETFQPKHV